MFTRSISDADMIIRTIASTPVILSSPGMPKKEPSSPMRTAKEQYISIFE